MAATDNNDYDIQHVHTLLARGIKLTANVRHVDCHGWHVAA